jgi:Zn-dependent peptidase ImmA (M78 family)
LHQPLDFFVRPIHVTLDRVRYRKHSKLSISRTRAIQDQALDFFERYWEIEEIMEARRPFCHPLPNRKVTKPDDVRSLAKRLRSVWQLGSDPLPNVHELLELLGIKVFELPISDRTFDGFSAETTQGPVVVIARWLNQDIPRKRMTEVHELAHIILQIPDEVSEREEEKIVWQFAGELLLPEESFRDAFGKRTCIDLSELLEFKAHFGASMMAIVYRAKQLELITDSAYRSFFRYANAQGWRRVGEPGVSVYTGSESYSRFRTLVHRGVVEQRISESKAAAYLHQSIAELHHDLDKMTFK